MFRLKTITVFASAVALSATASANLLENSGFEDPVVADGAPFVGEWEGFAGGGAAGSGNSTINPLSGAQHLAANIDASPNSFAGAFQDEDNLNAGDIATFSIWALDALGDTGSGVEMRMEFRDSVSDTEIGRTINFVPGDTLPALTNNNYTLLSISETIPAGADTIRAVVAIQSFGGPATQSIFFDDASLTVVPEPASLAMAGLGALALMRRRK